MQIDKSKLPPAWLLGLVLLVGWLIGGAWLLGVAYGGKFGNERINQFAAMLEAHNLTLCKDVPSTYQFRRGFDPDLVLDKMMSEYIYANNVTIDGVPLQPKNITTTFN